MRPWLFTFFAVLGFLSAPARAATERAYWVWHRTAALNPQEGAELQRQAVRTLYWHIGEMDLRGGVWRWKVPPLELAALAPAFEVVPVVRLNAGDGEPFSRAAVDALAADLKARATSAGALQLDFDCPDRLLARYAEVLGEIRRGVPQLSITALAAWSQRREFSALQQSVSAIAPMFYDLQADPAGVSAAVPPPPLLDPAQTAAALASWSRCAIPWRAGLPAFARLTIFDRTGNSRGQIPNWNWAHFIFHPSLRTLGPTTLGRTLYRVDAATRVAETPVEAGEMVVSRRVDRDALAAVVEAARGAGAAGVVFFRLPGLGDADGVTLRDLGALGLPEKPRLRLRPGPGEQLELVNDTSVDLPPRLAGEGGDRDRGYALEIDVPRAIFREAEPGDFWRVTAHLDPDSPTPRAVAVPLATRLTFWFTHLPAGAALRTGLFQLAPPPTPHHLRYRILHFAETPQWTSFDAP